MLRYLLSLGLRVQFRGQKNLRPLQRALCSDGSRGLNFTGDDLDAGRRLKTDH